MRHDRVFVLGLLVGAVSALGCSAGSSTSGDGSAGVSGSGGARAGTGGAPTDGAVDHVTGVGGHVDAAAAGGNTGTGGTDAGSDAGVDVRDSSVGDPDARDSGSPDLTPCMTSYGAANPVQFAFNDGENAGWTGFVAHDEAHSGLTTSLGASFTEGRSCAGSLLFASNFMAYGAANVHNESAATEYFYAVSPNGRDWSAYKALHAWVKLETADFLAVNGVYFYVKSANNARYGSAFGASADLADWHELVIDLTNAANVAPRDIQLTGFEVLLNVTPPPGAPARPSRAILLVDDIWLEALPPVDAGLTPEAGPGLDGGAGDVGAGDSGAGQ